MPAMNLFSLQRKVIRTPVRIKGKKNTMSIGHVYLQLVELVVSYLRMPIECCIISGYKNMSVPLN